MLERLPERVASKIALDPSGCWIWTATRTRDGYGRVWQGGSRTTGKLRQAHRLIYEALVGPIPAGLQLDHLCRVHACVNPTHLEPVTQRENLLRGSGIPAKNAVKKRCPLGHEYDVRVCRGKVIGRVCRECARNGARRQRQRHLAYPVREGHPYQAGNRAA